ncbi:MAG: hypothetical protein ACOYM9_26465, partial [Bradymonadia bacterium]
AQQAAMAAGKPVKFGTCSAQVLAFFLDSHTPQYDLDISIDADTVRSNLADLFDTIGGVASDLDDSSAMSASLPLLGKSLGGILAADNGRTLGDLVAGLRLVTTDAAPVGPLRSAAYTLLTVAGALPLLLGWLVPAVVPSRQGPAEWLTGTRRIRGLPRGPAR